VIFPSSIIKKVQQREKKARKIDKIKAFSTNNKMKNVRKVSGFSFLFRIWHEQNKS
jgi:hypothetical protein